MITLEIRSSGKLIDSAELPFADDDESAMADATRLGQALERELSTVLDRAPNATTVTINIHVH